MACLLPSAYVSLTIEPSVDDAFLQQAASSIPKKAIFLIEDIDCAFSTGSRDPSCTDPDDGGDPASLHAPGMALGMSPMGYMGLPPFGRRCNVTLSGLLNVIDGIGSEEGVLFFATVSQFIWFHPTTFLNQIQFHYRQTMSKDLTEPSSDLEGSTRRWNTS
jgi:hypothetical protein